MEPKKDEYYREEKLKLGAVCGGWIGQWRERCGLREVGPRNVTKACVLHGVIVANEKFSVTG